ncbi:hypothetical protein LCGC14_2093910, partial [marine sediment metagenome]
PGLSQALTWDGKDGGGKPVSAAGCTVHVGLGLEPRFDRILGWRGEAVGPVCGLTVDSSGQLHVLTTAYKKPTSVHVLTRQGKYVRTFMPYPANLPHEKVKNLGLVEVAPNQRVPIMRDPISFSFYPEAYATWAQVSHPVQTIAIAGDKLVFSNIWTGKYATKVTNRRLMILNTDGSIPPNYLGPLLTNRRSPGYVHLAAAPDGKHVFASGLVESGGRDGVSNQVVYRVALDEKGPARVYLGELNKAGSDETHFNDPRGVAVDKHGNLYVADNGNSRIVLFDPKGRFLGQVPVEFPGQLAVHQRSGAMYTLCGKRRFPGQATRLVKLSPAVDARGRWKGASEVVASMKWSYSRLVFAVDATADPTVVWVGCWLSKTGRFLLRMEEKAGAFGALKPILPAKEPALVYGGFLAVDRQREEVYTQTLGGPGNWGCSRHWTRINAHTGEITQTRVPGANIAVGPKGFLYVLGGRNYMDVQLLRFDREGKAVPFSGTGSNMLAQGNFMKGDLAIQHGPAGHCVGPNGDVYIMYPDPKRKCKRTVVDVYGPDGKLKRKELVLGGHGAEGIRVDGKGNIYLADNIKAESAIVPPELQGKVPNARNWKHGVNWYSWYGSVLKFPPGGGTAWSPEATSRTKTYTSGWGRGTVNVEGATWVRTGIYPMPGGAAYLGCACFGPRFDVDGFGRVF